MSVVNEIIKNENNYNNYALMWTATVTKTQLYFIYVNIKRNDELSYSLIQDMFLGMFEILHGTTFYVAGLFFNADNVLICRFSYIIAMGNFQIGHRFNLELSNP